MVRTVTLLLALLLGLPVAAQAETCNGVSVPGWSTQQRPTQPNDGTVGFNRTTGSCETYLALTDSWSDTLSQFVQSPARFRGALTVTATPLETRRPVATDDSTVGYAAGDLWRGPGSRMWQAQRVTPGAAAWLPVWFGAQPLPADAAASAPSAVYGMRKLRAAYAGALIRVQRSSDSTQTDVNALSSGLIDTATLWAFCANTICRVATMYDQSGNAFNATQATFNLMPLVGPQNNIGNSPSILPEFFTTTSATSSPGTSATEYLTIPVGLSVTSHALSFVSVSRARLGFGGSSNAEILLLGSEAGLAIQLATFARLGYGLGSGNDGYTLGRTYATPQVSAVVMNSSGVYKGNIDNQPQNPSGSYLTLNTFTGGRIGGNTGASVTSPVTVSATGDTEIGQIIVWPANLSATDVAATMAASYAAFDIVPQARNVVVFHGDSIVRGFHMPWGIGMAGRLADALPSNVRLTNKGGDGNTLTQSLSTISNDVTPYYSATAPNSVYVLYVSGNGIINSAQTDVQEEATFTSLISAVKAIGFTKVIVLTSMARTATGQQETYRLALNAWVLANAGALGYSTVDLGSDPLVGVTGASASSTYFLDGTHLTPLGSEIASALFIPAVMNLLQ